MGCASSTPMVATAGSEMLKAATHVAGDVKQQGEAAVEDASKALSSTLDTAKETVSTAVAGITSELGNAFKEGTDALDEAKHKVMEGLHLESATAAEPSSSRAATPTLEADGDSLKTSTPEPEIERALANEEEAPPTPKPSLQELAELGAQVSDASVVTVVAATVTTTTTSTTTTSATAVVESVAAAASVDKSPWQRKANNEEELEQELRRPSTTEWEKLADQLAKSKKFRPYESFARNQNQFSVYKDYTSQRDRPGHYDGHFSDGNSLSSTSQSQSDLSSGHLTPAPPGRRGQRDYAKFVGAEQAASVSRSSSRLSNARTFDFNPQRERLPVGARVGGSRAGSPRRSLWARGQGSEAVLDEEPVRYTPVRRSSLVAGLRSAADRQLKPITRSTSNLQPSRRQHREQWEQQEEKQAQRIATQPAHKEPGVMVPKERPAAAQPCVSLTQTETAPQPAAETAQQAQLQHVKPQLSESLKSMLDSSRDISSALLLATPSAEQQAAKVPTPSAARAATFVAEPRETRAVTHAAPQKPPTADGARSFMADVIGAEEHALMPPSSGGIGTPRTALSLPQSPSRRGLPNAAPMPKSASRPSSRLSSSGNSSCGSEVVIRALSQLNTPRAVSQSPDEVVVTEYDESDLEAALARLADGRGSTAASLRSLRSSKRSSNTSRRTSPWIRHSTDHSSHCQALKSFRSCLDISSPVPGALQQVERCEICCSEFVMP